MKISRKDAAAVTKMVQGSRPRRRFHVVRNAGILTAVAGMLAAVAVPAYTASQPAQASVSLHDVAAGSAQNLVVASQRDAAAETRDSYAATTPEEVDKIKAQRAAEEAAKARMSAVSAASFNINLSMTAPGSGAVRFPLGGSPTIGDGFHTRSDGSHDGVDMLIAQGTPIFAATSGTVTVSSEAYYGYGVAVVINGSLGGQSVTTTYGHMTYGSRVVSQGQHVEAGQLIGLVGSTGSSTANHLHFEVQINGSLVDPWAWLNSNLG